MAKVKKQTPIQKFKNFLRPDLSWVLQFGAPAGIALLFALLLYSSLLPKSQFQQAKEKILTNPSDTQAHLTLAEEFLKNNQLKEAERELTAASDFQKSEDSTQVLGFSSRLDELWQKWQEENPQELQKLIATWEETVTQTPTYRDGYLHLALYYFKLGNSEKARENLQRAQDLDPEFSTTLELEKLITQ